MENLLNKKAPDFKLQDQDKKWHSLKDYAGKKVLLYFYPKDMTSGCTLEAQCFRDRMNNFKKSGVQVLGVSVDDVKSHRKFVDKEKLNFPLLADVDKEVVGKYGKKYMGIQRDTFLIDENGMVLKHYEKVKPEKHVDEVMAEIISRKQV